MVAAAQAGSAVSESGASSDWASVDGDDALPDLEDVSIAPDCGATGAAEQALQGADLGEAAIVAEQAQDRAVHVTLLSTSNGDNAHVSVLIEKVAAIPPPCASSGGGGGNALCAAGGAPAQHGTHECGGDVQRATKAQRALSASIRWRKLCRAIRAGSVGHDAANGASACRQRTTAATQAAGVIQSGARFSTLQAEPDFDRSSCASRRGNNVALPRAAAALASTIASNMGSQSSLVPRSESCVDAAASITRPSSCISFVSVERSAFEEEAAGSEGLKDLDADHGAASAIVQKDDDKPVYGLHSSVLRNASDSVEEPSRLDGPFVALGLTAAHQAHADAAAERAEADRERLQELGTVEATLQPYAQRQTSSAWWASLASMWPRMG